MSALALMMAGWAQLSTGEDLDRNATEHESGGGDKPLLAKGTVLAMVCEAVRQDEFDNEETGQTEISYSVQWKCLDGEWKNRVEFQRLKLFDEKDNTRDNALKMLNAMDNNMSGGKAMLLPEMPTAEELQQLWQNKVLLVKFDVWKNKDKDTNEVKMGNFVKAVAGKKKKQESKTVHTTKEDAQNALKAQLEKEKSEKNTATETPAQKVARLKAEQLAADVAQAEADLAAQEEKAADEPEFHESNENEDPGY